ncbi:hypothetical protein NDN11_11685 [Acinetobacter sp. C26M]|uniref:hypothetical protein n=1 Tax=unclassified Acinetobacter TaxID=196816 RepID=UPI0020376073|nr:MULTISPECIES: hypothetical protein [unclassified Acinetobacter]USA45383.1 hypothetical protein NDN11_11685 [Acinetobacter sp. C26M]USA48885.1 hypothetical protein NDN12_11685 [Acinetobacter sp. C26G]
MENIKVDHLARTVYDNKEELENKFKKQESNTGGSFLNDIKQKDIKEIDGKNVLIKKDFKHQSSKMNDFVELYELKSIATNHLSYLDHVRNIQFEVPDYLLTIECLKNYGVTLENKAEQLITKDGKIENNKQYFDFFPKSNSKIDQNFSIDLPTESRVLTCIPSEVLKKHILITKSELFVRDFHGNQHDLLENIKRQLPDSIDRIWLNGKMVWSKT